MTANTFSGLEMLKIAILMEEEGKNFYLNGAKHTNGETKEFLLTAAKQETIHKERFTKIYNDLLGKEEVESEYAYLFDMEVTGYLRALIEDKVFDKKEQAEDAFKDLKAALTHAIKAETLTVDVYTKMYEGINNGEVKTLLTTLIEEEKAHVAYFSKLLEDHINKA